MPFAVEQFDAGQTLAMGGWVGGLISLAGTAVTAYLAYRLSRDRLQVDAEVLSLKGRVRDLERDVAEARRAEERAVDSEKRCRAEVADLRAELKQMREYILTHGSPGMPAYTPPASVNSKTTPTNPKE